MFSNLKDIWNKLENSLSSRMGDSLSGPFLLTMLLVFWEIPIYLFFDKPIYKVDNINQYLEQSWPWNLHIQIEKIWVVLIFWIFWVFLFPFFSPFVKKQRSKLIELSEKMNKFESYNEIKTKLERLEKAHQELVEESIKFETFKSNIKAVLNENPHDNFVSSILFKEASESSANIPDSDMLIIRDVSKLITNARTKSNFKILLEEELLKDMRFLTILQFLKPIHEKTNLIRTLLENQTKDS